MIYAGQSLSVAPFENVLESFENANLDHIHKLVFTRKWGVFIVKLSSQCFYFIIKDLAFQIRESDDSSRTNSFLEFWIINLRLGFRVLGLGF